MCYPEQFNPFINYWISHAIPVAVDFAANNFFNNFESTVMKKRSKPLARKSIRTYNKKAWKRGYESCTGEICEVVSTNLPNDIEGTYFRLDFLLIIIYNLQYH
jgi:hypothetical protein